MKYKLKVVAKENCEPFTGRSHGLTFVNGESEEFDNTDLFYRMINKGYGAVDGYPQEVKEPTKKEKLLAKCEELGIDVTSLDTISLLEEAIKNHSAK